MPTPFEFTKLIKEMELNRSSSVDFIEDEIEEFTPTQIPPTPVSQCSIVQVLICWFIAIFHVRFYL